ncbi:MAG: DNRLRE domain-containing protein [Anaerolineales bacterium]|nr:MAG: DNRLRE domain-containing protein [Anaerolineales bacterium]
MRRLLLPTCALALCLAGLGVTAAAQNSQQIDPDQSVGVLSEDPVTGDRWSTTVFPFGNYVGPDSGNDVFCRTYLRFPLGSIPSDATITSAMLRVYVDSFTSDPGSAAMSAYPVTTEWTPGSIDWYNSGAWPTLGSAVATTALTSDDGWFSWDVTGLIQGWMAGTPNRGLAVAAADLGSTAGDWAAARRDTASNPDTSPHLVVTFRTADPPPAEPSDPGVTLLPVTGEGPAQPTDWLLLAAAGFVLAAVLAVATGRRRVREWTQSDGGVPR